MRVRLLALSVAAGIALPAGIATAQTSMQDEVNSYPQTVVVLIPASGATVGRSVTFTGSAKPDISLGVMIDGKGYVDPRDRNYTGEGRGSYNFKADQAGKFSFTLDLSGNGVVRGSGPEALATGTHTFVVHELYADTAGRSQAVPLTVKEGATTSTSAPAVRNAQPSGQATSPATNTSVTPSLSPSIQPAASAIVKGSGVSPALIVGVLSLLGALLVVAAHYISPVLSHRKK